MKKATNLGGGSLLPQDQPSSLGGGVGIGVEDQPADVTMNSAAVVALTFVVPDASGAKAL
jgi:hypothetical protein